MSTIFCRKPLIPMILSTFANFTGLYPDMVFIFCILFVSIPRTTSIIYFSLPQCPQDYLRRSSVPSSISVSIPICTPDVITTYAEHNSQRLVSVGKLDITEWKRWKSNITILSTLLSAVRIRRYTR